MQVGSGQVGSVQVGSGQVGSGQVGSEQVGSGQVGSVQVGSGQVGSVQVGSGQVGSGQVGSGQVGFIFLHSFSDSLILASLNDYCSCKSVFYFGIHFPSSFEKNSYIAFVPSSRENIWSNTASST